MAKSKKKFTVLNDYNEIVAHFTKQREDERNIVVVILGVCIGIALVLLYVFLKG